MKLPTSEQCLDLFNEFKVPKNILQHCLKVREVAVFLAESLRQKGIKIDVNLVGCAAFLHDLLKVVSLTELDNKIYNYNYGYSEEEIAMWKKLRVQYLGMYENEAAYLLLKDLYPELALTIKNSGDPKKTDQSWEELVVHYADWRVLLEKVVSANERLLYLKVRYQRNRDDWNKYKQIITEHECKLFAHLDFSPEELGKIMEENKEMFKIKN